MICCVTCGSNGSAAENKYEAWQEWNERAGGRAPKPSAEARDKHIALQGCVQRLALAVMKEAVQKGWADIWEPSWNYKAHVELTLTIAEVRLAARLVGYHPTKADISSGDELSKWDALIAEIDSRKEKPLNAKIEPPSVNGGGSQPKESNVK